MSRVIQLTPATSPVTLPMTAATWDGGGAVPTVWVHPTGGNTVSVEAWYGNGTVVIVWPPGTVSTDTTYSLVSRCDYLVFTLVSGSDTGTTCGVAGQ